MTEDEMFGWHHLFSGYEFEQAREMVKDREMCCSPRGCKELDVSKRLNNSIGKVTTVSFL